MRIRSLFLAPLVASSLLAAACGGSEDDDAPAAAAGAAGSAGSKAGAAGKAGTGGTNAGGAGAGGASAGTSGAAGKAGASGSAGTGGTAGASGAAGKAGGAGVGGAGASGAGGAGASGKAGSGGAGAGGAGAGGIAGGGGAGSGGAGAGGAGAGGAGAGGAGAGGAGSGGAGAGGAGAGGAGAGGAGAGGAGAGGAGAGGAGTGGSGGAANPCAGKADTTPCDDGNGCTVGDACALGVCVSGAAKTCAASDQCHAAGTCDPGTGQCSDPNQPDGTSCNDSDACTQTDTCQAGVCTGGNPVVCPTSPVCKTAGVCDAQTGACSAPKNAPNLTPCDDGNPCTIDDYCIAGGCFAGSAKPCPWIDGCHKGSCNPGSGACESAQVNDGDPCVDGDVCTSGDKCTAGACGGTGVCAPGAATSIVISEFRTRLMGDTSNEFVEIYNTTSAPIDISGYKLKFSNAGNTVTTRATVPAGKIVPAFGHYLFVHTGYNGAVPGDQPAYTTGVADNGGIAITTPGDVILDQVGMSAAAALKEGTFLTPMTNTNAGCYERLPGSGHGGPIDTNGNSVDFFKNTVCDPQNVGSEVTPAFAPGPRSVFLAGLSGAPVQASTTITNTSTGSITLQSATIGGANAAEFTFGFASPLPQALASGGTLVVTITHTPTASGRRFATLFVTTSNGETQAIELMAGDAP